MPSIETLAVQISVGRGASLGKVETKKKTWKTFKAMFSRQRLLVDTDCNFAQYKAMDLDAQGKKKMAAGNWMPALFKDGRRKGPNQLCRTMVVFDLDYVTIEQLDAIRDGDVPISRFAWLMHTTRGHYPEKPRVRLIVPCDRRMTLDECNALTRILASELANDPEEGIEIPDTVSMKSNQIMYLPSTSRDQEYWTDENEADVLDVDEFLAEHPYWEDHALLPYKESEKNRGKIAPNGKMEDPTEKPGIIGAFCRTYDVEDAIAEFIPEVYAPGDDGGSDIRYTYLLGSGSNGAVVYDGGLFIYSNHGTDPIEGAANAWDMVRIHKFGHLDKDSPGNTLLSNLPSSKAMMEMARNDEAVRHDLLENVVPDDEWDDDGEEPADEPGSGEAETPPGVGPSVDELLGIEPDSGTGDDDDDEQGDIADLFGDDGDESGGDENPSQAAKLRPLSKVSRSGANAATAPAVTGPISGIVQSRRRQGSVLVATSNSLASRSITSVSRAICST